MTAATTRNWCLLVDSPIIIMCNVMSNVMAGKSPSQSSDVDPFNDELLKTSKPINKTKNVHIYMTVHTLEGDTVMSHKDALPPRSVAYSTGLMLEGYNEMCI